MLLKWCLNDGEARLYLLSFKQMVLRGGKADGGGVRGSGRKQRRRGEAAEAEKDLKEEEGEEDKRRIDVFQVYLEPCPASRHLTDRPGSTYLKRVRAFRKDERPLQVPLPPPKLFTSFFPSPPLSSLVFAIAPAVPSSVTPSSSVLLPSLPHSHQQQHEQHQEQQRQQHKQQHKHQQQQQQQQQQQRQVDGGGMNKEDGGKNDGAWRKGGSVATGEGGGGGDGRGGEEGGSKRGRGEGGGEEGKDDAVDIAAILESITLDGSRASGTAGAETEAAAAAAVAGGGEGGSGEVRGGVGLGARRATPPASKRSQEEEREEKEEEEGEEEEEKTDDKR